MIGTTLALSSALVVAGMPPASARTTFFNNFPYNQYYGYFVCGSTACGGVTKMPAMQFVSGMTGTTGRVSVSVSQETSGYAANVQIMLRADKNGLPGKVLAKKNATGQPCCMTTTVKMAVNLTAGTPYWLEIAPRTADDSALWQISDSANTCTIAEDYNGTGWSSFSTEVCPAAKIVGGIK